jgi:hypothetical protein
MERVAANSVKRLGLHQRLTADDAGQFVTLLLVLPRKALGKAWEGLGTVIILGFVAGDFL